MKKENLLIALAIATGVVIASCNGSDTSTEETAEKEVVQEMIKTTAALNAESSNVEWKGEVAGVYGHFGTLKFKEGNVEMENGKIAGGKFVVDMGTITATDENYQDGKTPADLVGHLASPDFFDVANHPTATFEITSVEGTTAMGTLTTRGVSNPEKVENITMSDNKIGGTLTFDRQKYGISFEHPMKDMVLSDDISLKIEVITE